MYSETLGMKESAFCDFTRAIELNPVHIDALFKRALLARKEGRLDLCVADLGKCIDYTRAIRFRDGESSAANKVPVMIRDQRLLVFLLVRGVCNRLLGNYQAALDDFELASLLQDENVSRG